MLATGTPNEDRVSERSKFSLVSKAAGGKIRRWLRGTSLVVQWLRLHVPYAKGLGLIPHQGTRSHRLQLRVFLPQLKIPRVATKTWCSQINKNKPKKKWCLRADHWVDCVKGTGNMGWESRVRAELEWSGFKKELEWNCKQLVMATFKGVLLQSRFGEGNGTPLQYSCLEIPMDGGAWRAAVHGFAQSRTRLSNFTHSSFLRRGGWE